MNNWNTDDIAFRCARLPVRIERLAQHLQRIGSLSLDGHDAEAVLKTIRESKVFIELTAIDLDIDSAFELAQIQRQLSRWHLNWSQIWASDASRKEISTLSETWVARLREMLGVFV
jgi:3-hydroxyacyl-CoA dehydrogenase